MMVAGNAIKTDLSFSTLRECLEFEGRTANEYVDIYNASIKWAKENVPADQVEGYETLARGRLHRGTCIPATK
jgi:hypothetical protein